MKRRLVLVLALLLAATSNGLAGMTFEGIRAANDAAELLKTTPGVGVNWVYSDLHGRDFASSYAYAGDAGGAFAAVREDGQGNVEILTGGEGFGYDAENGTLYKIGFLGDQYVEAVTKFLQNLVVNVGEGTVTGTSLSGDGLTVAHVSIPPDAFPGPFEFSEGFLRMDYLLNPDTLKISRMRLFYADAAGRALPIGEGWVTLGDTYEISDAFDALKNPENPRTVTVIQDPGRKTQKTYTFTLPDDVPLRLTPPAGYVLCADPEGKTPPPTPDGSGSYPEALTLYLIPR